MNVDYRDGTTIVAGLTGGLLLGQVGVVLDTGPVMVWSLTGLFVGAGLSAYFFSVRDVPESDELANP
jgi:Na+/proline symporter